MTTPVTTTTETTSTTYTTTVTIEGTETNSTAITNDVESTIISSTGTTLPQTGYSKWYQTAVALAACITGVGGAMVIGSGTLKKKRR